MSPSTAKQAKSKAAMPVEQKPKPKEDSFTGSKVASGSQPESKPVEVKKEPRVEVLRDFTMGQKRDLVAMFRSDLSMDKLFDHLGPTCKAIAFDCIHFHFEVAPFTGSLNYKFNEKGEEIPDFVHFVFEWTIPGMGHTFKVERKIPYEKFLRFI